MQPRGRLVEQVQGIGERCEQDPLEPQSLRLAEGQRACRPSGGERIEAELAQSRQPLHDSIAQPTVRLDDGRLREEGSQLGERTFVQVGDRPILPAKRERLRPEAAAPARGARFVADSPVTLRTRGKRIGRIEAPRRRLGDRDPAPGAAPAAVEEARLGPDDRRQPAVAAAIRRLDRFEQSLGRDLGRFDAVGDDERAVVRRRQIGLFETMHFRADANADPPLLAKPGRPVGHALSLRGPIGKPEKHGPRGGKLPERLGDLGRQVRSDRFAACRTDRRRDAAHPLGEKLVEFRDGADRRLRQRRLGAQRDRRRQIADPVGVRLIEAFEPAASGDGEALEITALGLGVERVEDEAALAGPAHAGHERQLAERKRDVRALEIVDADAAESHQSRCEYGHFCRAFWIGSLSLFGSTLGAILAMTLPSRPIRNFSKFQLMSPACPDLSEVRYA